MATSTLSKRVPLSGLDVNKSTPANSPRKGNFMSKTLGAADTPTMAHGIYKTVQLSLGVPTLPLFQCSPAGGPKRKAACNEFEGRCEERNKRHSQISHNVVQYPLLATESVDTCQISEKDDTRDDMQLHSYIAGCEESREGSRTDIRRLGSCGPSEAASRHSSPRSSSFDMTQEPKSTALAEEDIAVQVAPVAESTLRATSPVEARELAETLKLRLKVALYKVRTNQTNLPLSQLEVRPSTTSKLSAATARIKLASQARAKSAAIQQELDIRSSPPLSNSPSGIRHDILPSPSPTKLNRTDSDLATPVLPRSRDGPLEVLRHLQSPEFSNDLTSSVVKGRAADGLLSLMASRG